MWRIPHEAEHHSCTWMAWPWDSSIWNCIPGTNLREAQGAIDRLLRTILKYEKVRLLAPSNDKFELEKRFKSKPGQQFCIEIISAEYNDIWVRDTVPTFAISNCDSLVAINWQFNGWGQRIRPYAQYGKDAEVGRKVAALAGARIVNSGFTAEGGAFAFDGNGLIVATKSVMFDKSRNHSANKDALENALLKASCCKSVCWLPGDRHEPITSGHADGILSFGDRNVVFFHWTEDETSPEYDVCDYNLRVFQEWSDRQGRHYEVVRLPVPYHPYGDNFCASYVNFVHVNGAVIVPKYGDGFSETNEIAHEKIYAAFGGKVKVEILDMQAIAAGGGSIHCATCHEPASNCYFCAAPHS
jgi:agmatine deiminase